ncbi:penicillin acylase family protein [Paraburkholderia acidicola]|uniref:Penicillin acylase family protein n=1 Tax=Paraburkholderia acidicola TaxID=1912599 RepID=A0ABV1LHP5_9BURK
MANSFRVLRALAAGLAASALFAGCTAPVPQDSVANVAAASYHAQIRRTQDGIPHIKADDWGSLGYGFGYVQAQDDLCTLADSFVTWRGERSSYFGADARPPAAASFGKPRNLDADFFFRLVDDDAAVQRFRTAQTADFRTLLGGFAQGYNRYLDELKAGRFPGAHQACANEPWVTRITTDDLYRRLIALNLAGGATQFLDGIVRAQPPGTSQPLAEDVEGEGGAQPLSMARMTVGGHAGIGSNALAFGAPVTRDGKSLLFGNPHWFWRGPDRFYEAQLTIPGQLDVAGASFLAVPVVVIGFNHDIAWTHTVSNARRFGIFELKLVPGAPTHYLYDGKDEALQAVPITIKVRDAATGSLAPVTRTLYRSRFGPMIDLSSMSPALAWNAQHAFALRDVNAENNRTFANFLAWGQARSLDDFMAIQKRFAAMPWANTFAIGRDDPRVWFADIGAVPNVPDPFAAACTTPLGQAFDKQAFGVPFLDGSRSACAWDAAPAPSPQQADALSPDSMPSLLRTDYVGNFNGSYWLTNPRQPLTGFARITGETGGPQSLRTRLGHALAAKLMAEPGGLTRDALERTVLDSTSMSERLARKPLLDALCVEGKAAPVVRVVRDLLDGKDLASPQTVDLTEACRVLRNWDGTANADARGANLWDEFWRRASQIPDAQLYAAQFDANRPLTTPAGLNTTNPAHQQVLEQALAGAVLALQRNDFAPGSTRGELLYTVRNGDKVPMYGGCDGEGYFTAACAEHPLDHEGYALDRDAHGNSYLQVVGFGDDGPHADTLLAPSESDDPASPHHVDATAQYARKNWLRFSFTEHAISTAPGMTEQLLTGPRAAAEH